MVQTAFDVPKVPNDSAKEDEGQSKTTFSGIMGLSKAAQKLKTTKGRIPKSCRTSTMDAAKALGILGFTSTRWLDMSSGLTPKQELDKAHFDKMMAITKKKVIFNGIKFDYGMNKQNLKDGHTDKLTIYLNRIKKTKKTTTRKPLTISEGSN